MKLTLVYEWDCSPEAFWALYFDPDFAVRLHREALGSTSAEVDLSASRWSRTANSGSK